MKPNRTGALVALTASLFAGAVAAQESSVQLYGLIGLYAGRIERSNSPQIELLGHGGLTTSYIGFRGSENLGGNLRAIFALEAFFQPDNGTPGRTGADPFFSRNAFAGFEGGFGRVTAGRQTNPTYANMGQVSAFGVSTVFSPLVLQSFVATYNNAIIGDTVWNNAIQYASPRVNGFQGSVLYALGENAPDNDAYNVGIHGNYNSGPLTLVLSAQQVRTPVVAPLTEQRAYLVGGAYDFKAAKAFGAHVRTDAEGTRNETRTSSLGVRVPTSPAGAVLAEVAFTKREAATDTTRRTASLGYDHRLSKRTDVYMVYSNDRLTGFEAASSFAVGIRHSF